MIMIIVLAGGWIYLAYAAYAAGNMQRAGFYILAGILFTGWRLARLRSRSQPPSDAPSDTRGQ
ncbi:MAG TPA: hypothetical protein VGI83_03130 [Gemmatimonadales bacterium]|jgi:hypothetical protein